MESSIGRDNKITHSVEKELGDTQKKTRRPDQCQFSNSSVKQNKLEETKTRPFTTSTASKGESKISQNIKKPTQIKTIELGGSNLIRTVHTDKITP